MAVLTIAREYGTGGKMIGRAVAEQMGYQYKDRKQIREDIGSEGKKWEEQVGSFDESLPNAWDRYKWHFRGYVTLNQYYILSYALKDNVVIMGRGGSFLLKNIPHVLRVRTTAPLDVRIHRVMEFEEIDSTAGANYLISKADQDMAGAVYMIYGGYWDDPKQYDIVFDTGKQTYDEVVAIIKEELLKKDKLRTEEAQKILALKVLAAKIKATIATDPTLYVKSLNLGFKEEGLVKYGLALQGVVNDKKDIKRVEEIVKSMAGSVPVDIDLQYRWHSRFGSWEFK